MSTKKKSNPTNSQGSAKKFAPVQAIVTLQQALQLQQQGNFALAQQIYREILRTQPDHFDALHLLGVCCFQSGDEIQAIELITKAIALKSDYPNAYFNLGNAYKSLKQTDEALANYNKALELKPDYFMAYNNRGNLLKQLKRFNEALSDYNRALKYEPNQIETLNNRGLVYIELSRFNEALADFDRAERIDPNNATTLNNRGIAHLELHRFDESMADLNKAIRIKPDYVEAYNNRGNTLRAIHQFDEAIKSYEIAKSIDPDYVDTYHNMASAFIELKRPDEALAYYQRAAQILPAFGYMTGAMTHAKLNLSDWKNFNADLDHLETTIAAGKEASFPFAMLGLTDRVDIHLQAAKIWSSKYQVSPPIDLETTPKNGQGKLRIGYYSADFHNHATAYLIAELIESHNKEKFEIYGFSFGSHSEDEMRMRLSSAFDHFIDVNGMSDDEVVLQSRSLNIDIAIDLKGYTSGARDLLFTRRCAPIQVNYLGYPGTLGTDYHDYLIADNTVINEESRAFFTEKIVYLPHSYQVNDSRRKISARTPSRQELGLPDTGFVYCCFNTTYKITPTVFDSWMRILNAVPGSVLWLISRNSIVVNNLRAEAETRGIDPQRLIFAENLPLDEHLARYRSADLFLDTLPYNAHTTASDALWAGVPVLTQIGKSFAARVAASLLNTVGLQDLITYTQDEYEAKAIQLSRDTEYLASLKNILEQRRHDSPLFDGKLFARHLEKAYTHMHALRLARQPAQDFHVDP